MPLTSAQAIAIGLLCISLIRTSHSFARLHAWLLNSKDRARLCQVALYLNSAIAGLPEFLCSAKALDFAVLLVKV